MHINLWPRLVPYFLFVTLIIPNLVYSMDTDPNNHQASFYTHATRTVLQKTFHVLERGEVPHDMEDLTPSNAGRKPSSPLYTKKMCADLIQNRMNEYVDPCIESKYHTNIFLEHGKLLSSQDFKNCIYADLQNQHTDKDKTELQDFYEYLITAAMNAYNKSSTTIETSQTTPIAKSSTQVVTTNQSSPWYIRARKRIEKTVFPYLPVTAQEVFFVDKEVDKYIADLPRLVEEEKETIFQEQAQKYEQLWTHTKPHKKQKNWLALIHQYKKHQDTILFFAEHHKSIELYMLATAYIKAKSLPPLLRTEKQSWLIPTMEQWAFQQYTARKKRKLQNCQTENSDNIQKSSPYCIGWKITTQNEQDLNHYHTAIDTNNHQETDDAKEEDIHQRDSKTETEFFSDSSSTFHKESSTKNEPKKKSFFNEKNNKSNNKMRYAQDILNNEIPFEKDILNKSQVLKSSSIYQNKTWPLSLITHQVTQFTGTITKKQLAHTAAPYALSIFMRLSSNV